MKSVKKLICGAISCVFAASLLSGITLGVTAADDFSVKISSETAKPGESYTLTVDMENIPENGINLCEFGISYDPELVTVESLELGSLAADVTAQGDLPHPFSYEINTNVISVLFADVSGTFLKGSGTFFEISGKVSETADDGSEAVFSIVPISRAVSAGSASLNDKAIFGNDETMEEYAPTLGSGKVSIRNTPVTTTTTQPTTTIVTQTVTTTVTQPVTTTVTQPVATTVVQPVTTVEQPTTRIVTQTVTIVTQPVTTTVTQPTTTKPVTAATTSSRPTTTKPVTTETAPTTTTGSGRLLGDVNLDKSVSAADVVLMQKYFVKAEKLSAEQFALADFNEDGSVNIFDVVSLKRFVINAK